MHDLRAYRVARAREVFAAVAELHGIAWPAHGSVSAIARQLGLAPQHIDKALRGERSTEWIDRIAMGQGVEVRQHADGSVTTGPL